MTAEEHELQKAIEALEGVINDNEQKKMITIDTLVQKMVVAFCDETTAAWQYFTAMHMIRGAGRVDAIDEYKEHMEDELEHLEDIATRLEEIGGKVPFNIDEISSIGHQWTRINTTDPKTQLTVLIKAEEDAIAFYQEIVNEARALQDWKTQKLFKELLCDEVEHAFDLKRLLEELD